MAIKNKLLGLLGKTPFAEWIGARVLVKISQRSKEALDNMAKKNKTGPKKSGTANTDFVSLLLVLDADDRNNMIQESMDKLPIYFRDAENKKLFFKLLTSEQCRAFCKKISKKDLVPYSLADIFSSLDHEQQGIVFDELAGKLSEFIESAKEFESLFQCLDPEQRRLAYDGLRDNIPRLVTSAKSFKMIFCSLNAEQGTDFFSMMEKRFSQVIRKSSDLQEVLEYLDPSQCRVLAKEFNKISSPVRQSDQDFDALIHFLLANPEKFQIIAKEIPSLFSHIFLSERMFAQFITKYPQENYPLIFEVMSKPLAQLIRGPNNLAVLLRELAPLQCKTVLKAMSTAVNTLIPSSKQLAELLQMLEAQKLTIVYETLIELRPDLQLNAHEIGMILKQQNKAQFMPFLKNMHTHIAKLSTSPLALLTIINQLDDKQTDAVLQEMKKQLNAHLSTTRKLGEFFHHLDLNKYKILSEDLHQQMSHHLSSAKKLGLFLKELDANQCEIVLQVMRARLQNIIKSAEDFRDVLINLHFEQCNICCLTLDKLLPGVKLSLPMIGTILKGLFPDKCRAALKGLRVPLAKLVKSPADLRNLLQNLNVYQAKVVCERCQDLIHSPRYFKSFLIIFTDLQIELLQSFLSEKAMRKQLKYLYPSAEEFVSFLKGIDDHAKRKIFYEAYSNKTISLDVSDSFLDKINSAKLHVSGSTSKFSDFFVIKTRNQKQNELRQPLAKFRLALAKADLSELRMAFNKITKRLNEQRSKYFKPANTASYEQFIDSLAQMKDKEPMKTLNKALELGLDEEKLARPDYEKTIKKALLNYKPMSKLSPDSKNTKPRA